MQIYETKLRPIVVNHKSSIVKIVISTNEQLVENLSSNMFRTNDKIDVTDTDFQQIFTSEDINRYNYDCAIPEIPDITGYEQSQVRVTRDVPSSPSNSLVDSAIATINGVALNVMSVGYNILNGVLPH